MGSGKKSARRDKERDVLFRMAIEAYRDLLTTGEGAVRAREVYAACSLLSDTFHVRIPTEKRIKDIADLEVKNDLYTKLRGTVRASQKPQALRQ